MHKPSEWTVGWRIKGGVEMFQMVNPWELVGYLTRLGDISWAFFWEGAGDSFYPGEGIKRKQI